MVVLIERMAPSDLQGNVRWEIGPKDIIVAHIAEKTEVSKEHTPAGLLPGSHPVFIEIRHGRQASNVFVLRQRGISQSSIFDLTKAMGTTARTLDESGETSTTPKMSSSADTACGSSVSSQARTQRAGRRNSFLVRKAGENGVGHHRTRLVE